MEAFRALAALAEEPVPQHTAIAGALGLGPPALPEEHAACFFFRFPPYASVYLGPEGGIGGVARDRIAGFWRALRLEPPAEVDQLVILLAFYANLGERSAGERHPSRQAALRHARAAFLHEHMLSWLPFFAFRMTEVAPPFYRRWATLLLELLADEWRTVGPPETLPAHLREAPGLPDLADPRGEEILTWLLTPVRSGLLLVRDDLARTAGEVDRVVRPGERRQILRTLLAERPVETLRSLAADARIAAVQHRALPTGPSARWWSERADATSKRLDDLARSAEGWVAEDRALSSDR